MSKFSTFLKVINPRIWENEIISGLNVLYFIMTLTCIIIEYIVCGTIYYTDQYIIQELYSLPDLNKDLAHWIQVYGALAVTRAVIFAGYPFYMSTILVTGTYLYISGCNLITKYSIICQTNLCQTNLCQTNININQTNINQTCLTYNNQFQLLVSLNNISVIMSWIIGSICLCWSILYLCSKKLEQIEEEEEQHQMRQV
jgi:hypothetical protein